MLNAAQLLGVMLANLVANPAMETAPCLHYGPDPVRLRGTVSRETFPGPPHYESLQAGDRPEVVWILTLSQPVCVDSGSGDEVNVKETGVTRIQLVLSSKQFRDYRRSVGTEVQAKGTLLHRTTGHHHEKILMDVEELRRSK